MTKKSILLVEDNPLDARFIVKAFESSELQNSITTVQDGEEALQYMTGQGLYSGVDSPQVMLLDLNMPKKSGLELLEDLKKAGILDRVGVIVLTTSDLGEDIEKCMVYGVKKFITKPLVMNDFIQEIRSIEPLIRSMIEKK